MIGTKNFWVNAFLVILVMASLYGIYLGVREAKIEAKIAFWLGLVTFVAAALITYGNKYNDKIKKEVDLKASKDEMNAAIEAITKRIDDHREDDKQKYDTLTNMVRETNSSVKQILIEMTKKNKK